MAGRPRKRTYDDPCGIARGLDVVGERWALLVVRELLLGPKRFTDLRRGLRTASQNVLSQRLRELEDAGVVRRRRLGPPAPTWVYELTPWGRGLEPVLTHLARWGSQVPMTAAGDLSPDALMIALKTMFDPPAAGDLRARYELRLGDDRFRARVAAGRLDIVRGTGFTDGYDDDDGYDGDDDGPDRPVPDAVLETDGVTLRALAFGRRELPAALRAGDIEITGDERAAARFLGLFKRPAAAPPAR